MTSSRRKTSQLSSSVAQIFLFIHCQLTKEHNPVGHFLSNSQLTLIGALLYLPPVTGRWMIYSTFVHAYAIFYFHTHGSMVSLALAHVDIRSIRQWRAEWMSWLQRGWEKVTGFNLEQFATSSRNRHDIISFGCKWKMKCHFRKDFTPLL